MRGISEYSQAVWFGVGAPKLQTNAWAREIGLERPVDRIARTLEEHALDADVIVEVLHVAQGLTCQRSVQRYMWRTMDRERDHRGLAQAVGGQEPAKSAASRGVRLQAIHGVGIEHLPKIIPRVTVLSGSYFHARRRAFAHLTQAFQIVVIDRLLEPLHAKRCELMSELHGLLS